MHGQVDTQVPDAQELALVLKAKKGDRTSFAELVRSYQRRVVGVAYRLLGNADDARDVGQDAFVKAFRSLSQLEDPTRFGPWLMRVVSNLSLNYRRSRTLRAATSLDASTGDHDDSDGGLGTRLVAGDGQPDSEPLGDELRDAIGGAMEKLPEKQRLALILFSVEGMPQKDVAEILDFRLELVKWNVFQARKKLKDMLAEYL
jgi:RNA polymerase sigma-70 factor (ECF subfamily)